MRALGLALLLAVGCGGEAPSPFAEAPDASAGEAQTPEAGTAGAPAGSGGKGSPEGGRGGAGSGGVLVAGAGNLGGLGGAGAGRGGASAGSSSKAGSGPAGAPSAGAPSAGAGGSAGAAAGSGGSSGEAAGSAGESGAGGAAGAAGIAGAAGAPPDACEPPAQAEARDCTADCAGAAQCEGGCGMAARGGCLACGLDLAPDFDAAVALDPMGEACLPAGAASPLPCGARWRFRVPTGACARVTVMDAFGAGVRPDDGTCGPASACLVVSAPGEMKTALVAVGDPAWTRAEVRALVADECPLACP